MRRLALLAASLLIAASCHAAPTPAPASRASVEALFALMNMDRTISLSLDKMQAMTKQSIAGMPQARTMSPEQRSRFEAGQASVDAMMRDEMTWARLEPDLVQVYMATFTQDEIDGQLAFYRTPAGQALIAKTPELTERTMAVMQTRIQALLPRMQEALQAAMRPAAPASAPN